jgi:hypothetical protein
VGCQLIYTVLSLVIYDIYGDREGRLGALWFGEIEVLSAQKKKSLF